MSPASKLKSVVKENSSMSATKDQQKSLSKHSGPTSTGNSSPGNTCSPVSGTFHSFDPHLPNADDIDEHSSSSLGTAAEYDSLSNNGSCSGESEDHKEKTTSNNSRQENIPGCDNEKREKIRQKNEKKHQRQRERRANELHERCCRFLMTRKWEELSQQLVAMGFSSERAKLALKLNEGRVEESVNWLFEGNEDEAQKDAKNMNKLKINISEELAQIAAMEVRYKCSKQEVERSVVASEGDLDKAEEALRKVKLEPVVTPTKPEVTSNVKQPTKPQDKSTEQEMNYLKGSSISEPGSLNFLPSKTNQPESLVERRWLNNGSTPSMSYSTVPDIQVAPSSAKMLAQVNIGGTEGRYVPQGVIREPIMMMQRPHSMNINQNYPPSNTSASPPGSTEWFANNGFTLLQKSNTGTTSRNFLPQAQSNNRSFGGDSRQYYPQQPFSTSSVSSVDSVAKMGSSWTPSRPVASSLGLFSGWGSTGTSGRSTHMDWNARDMMSICDYNSIDWTLEANSKPSGLTMPSVRVKGSNGGVKYGGRSTESIVAPAGGGGPREWTSPFAGNDLFSLPRQFVTSPSP